MRFIVRILTIDLLLNKSYLSAAISKDSSTEVKISLDNESLLESLFDKVIDTIKAAILANKSYSNTSNRRITLALVPPKKTIKKPEQVQTTNSRVVSANNYSTAVEMINMNRPQQMPSAIAGVSVDTVMNVPSNPALDSRKRPRSTSDNIFGNDTERKRIDRKEPVSVPVVSAPGLAAPAPTEHGFRTRNLGHNASSQHSLSNFFDASLHASELGDLRNRTDSVGDALEAIRIAERRQSKNKALVLAAAETARLQELQTAMNSIRRNSLGRNSMGRGSFGSSMASAAEAVRLAEMTNQLDSIGNRSYGEGASASNTNSLPLNLYGALSTLGQDNSTIPSSNSTAELIRLLEMNQRKSANSTGFMTPESMQLGRRTSINQSQRQGAGPGTSALADLAAILDPHNENTGPLRRSSFMKERSTMETVLNALRRRSSAGNSMTTAAEAVRMAEMDMAVSSIRQRQSRPSIVVAAEAVKMAEMDANRSRRRRASRGSFGNFSSIAAAAEAVRLSEAENMNTAQPYYRNNFGRNSFTSADHEILRDASATDDNLNMNAVSRSNGAGNSLTAGEVSRLTDLESNNAHSSSYAGNYSNQSQAAAMDLQQRVGSNRQRVSFRLNNNFNEYNGMNGFQN